MFLKLYDSTKIAKGHTKSIIWDTQSGFVQGIPNVLFALLSDPFQDYSELNKTFEADDKETLVEYINFIVENNLGFILESREELSSFKISNTYYEMPSRLDYLIIDIKAVGILNFELIESIIKTNIFYLQIRISYEVPKNEIEKIIDTLNLFNSSDIHEISIIAPYYYDLYSSIYCGNLLLKSDKYLNFVFYGADKDDSQNIGSLILTTIQKNLQIPICCGTIDFKNFNASHNFFLESINHNTCLHKKISIDKDGNIRNCPSMPQSFGNIKDTTLEEALAHPDFKKYWNLTKDHIEICKDCEFRHICTDCRAYTERTHTNKEGLDISKPLKCGYNPYTGEWAEWSTNPLKQKTIQYYGMEDLVKKDEN